jgi:hypothetical protein
VGMVTGSALWTKSLAEVSTKARGGASRAFQVARTRAGGRGQQVKALNLRLLGGATWEVSPGGARGGYELPVPAKPIATPEVARGPLCPLSGPPTGQDQPVS